VKERGLLVPFIFCVFLAPFIFFAVPNRVQNEEISKEIAISHRKKKESY
jgi:hypothetical protein